jgi:flavin reductase (DIM6/NTAB) family NADH-FMN oxidoreductase RutF|tara:strand:- start:157 stop:816 length:660 start_codon:yes stop_codon:yes gene_type:complete
MYYEPGKTAHGLPHDPFKSCVVPRPIGWISTLSQDGVANLAPFSQFQNLTFDPPYVMFSANQNTEGKRKDSVVNAETTQEFVWNMATYELRDAVNQSAMEVAPEEDEFELAGLTKVAAKLVKPPRVAESPVQFECAYHMTLRLPGKGVMGSSDVVIGRVLAVHIADEALTDEGRLDIAKLRPIARLGYHDYTSVESIFEMVIPGTNEDIRRGMEGWSED